MFSMLVLAYGLIFFLLLGDEVRYNMAAQNKVKVASNSSCSFRDRAWSVPVGEGVGTRGSMRA